MYSSIPKTIILLAIFKAYNHLEVSYMSNNYEGVVKECLIAAAAGGVLFYTFVILAFIFDVH